MNIMCGHGHAGTLRDNNAYWNDPDVPGTGFQVFSIGARPRQ